MHRRKLSGRVFTIRRITYPGFEDLTSEEVEVPGQDGVMVPLSIIHKKGIPLDGSNCCILEGYGAYGYSLHPAFNIMSCSLAARGVVIAGAPYAGGGRRARRSPVQAGWKKPPNQIRGMISSRARNTL